MLAVWSHHISGWFVTQQKLTDTPPHLIHSSSFLKGGNQWGEERTTESHGNSETRRRPLSSWCSSNDKVSRVHMQGQSEYLGQTSAGNGLEVTVSSTSSCQLSSLAAGERQKGHILFHPGLIPVNSSISQAQRPPGNWALRDLRSVCSLLFTSLLSLLLHSLLFFSSLIPFSLKKNKKPETQVSWPPRPTSFPDLSHLLHTQKRSHGQKKRVTNHSLNPASALPYNHSEDTPLRRAWPQTLAN